MNWQKQITLMFIVQLIIIAALEMSDPYWPLIIAKLQPLTAKQIQYWSGGIYMAPFITTIFTTPLWMRLGARIGYKKMILRAGYALALTQILLIFTTNIFLILCIRLLQGALAGFSAAAQAWSINIVPADRHSYAIGRLQAATALGAIIGPVGGGFIANYYGYASIFLSSGLVCALTITLLATYLQETTKQPHIQASKPANLFTHWQTFIFALLLLICLTQAARWMSTPFFALYVVDRIGGNDLSVGILYSCIGIAIALTTPLWGRMLDQYKIKLSIKHTLIITLLIASVAQFGYAFAHYFYLALVLSLLAGICQGVISLTLFSLLIKNTDAANKGSVIGFGNSAVKLGNLLGIALGALVKAEMNFTYSFILIGLLYFGIACFTYTLKTSQ